VMDGRHQIRMGISPSQDTGLKNRNPVFGSFIVYCSVLYDSTMRITASDWGVPCSQLLIGSGLLTRQALINFIHIGAHYKMSDRAHYL